MPADTHRAEFDDFVRSRSPALQRAAFLMIGDISLAQDLVQEALTKTYIAWPRLHRTASAEAYTRKAITTTAISWFRRRSWNNERVVATMPEHLSAGHDDAVVQKNMLWTCLQELPPRQRAAIVLRYYDDLTEAQTAAAMGCAVGTVKSQVSSGLAKLRAQLGADSDFLPLDDLVVTS